MRFPADYRRKTPVGLEFTLQGVNQAGPESRMLKHELQPGRKWRRAQRVSESGGDRLPGGTRTTSNAFSCFLFLWWAANRRLGCLAGKAKRSGKQSI